MSETLLIALLTGGLLISAVVNAWQESEIRKLKSKVDKLKLELKLKQ
jgi:hypothetical protein